MISKLNAIIIAIFGLLVIAVNVNSMSLTQSVNKSELAFEDSVQFDITIEWQGPQFAYRFTNPLNPYIDRLKIGRFSSSISSIGSGKDEITTKKFTYVLEPTSSGEGKIDPVTISYLSWPDSVAGELVTERVLISIADRIIVDESGGLKFWHYLLAAVILIGGGAGAFIARTRAAKAKVPVKTPVEMALEKLSLTKSESGGDLKKFQTGVFNLLSDLLISKYKINVTGKTEAEIEKLLSATPLMESHRHSLKDWLVRAERDKFRPLEASPGETVRLENELRKFLESLKV